MRWRGRRGSDNIEDRRRMGPGGKMIAGGGGVGMLIIVVIVLLLGGDPRTLLQNMPQGGGGVGGGAVSQTDLTPEEKLHGDFVSVVLADTEEVWSELFRTQLNAEYVEPKLVLFRGSVQSGCGSASAQVGPFYCPADSKVYIDLGFFNDLLAKLGAKGDFAQAYVIAHEVGHHVQNLLGVSEQAQRARRTMSETEYNQLSVRMELQADFYAGVWAHHAQKRFNILEPGDIEEAMRAAEAVGDDSIQRQTQGQVRPDSFTHGTSEQRLKWFMHGYRTGDLREGDTFSLPDPR